MLYSHTTVIIACLHLLVNGSAVFVSLERKKKKVCGSTEPRWGCAASCIAQLGFDCRSAKRS